MEICHGNSKEWENNALNFNSAGKVKRKKIHVCVFAFYQVEETTTIEVVTLQ